MRGVFQNGNEVPLDPFLATIFATVNTWVAGEWKELEAIRKSVAVNGWSAASRDQYQAAILNTENLAARLHNISSRKLRRELKRLGAPTPGEIIRTARIAYAADLLLASRLLVREVAQRAGYDSEKHFSEQFLKAMQLTPSAYRRQGARPLLHTKANPSEGDEE